MEHLKNYIILRDKNAEGIKQFHHIEAEKIKYETNKIAVRIMESEVTKIAIYFDVFAIYVDGKYYYKNIDVTSDGVYIIVEINK